MSDERRRPERNAGAFMGPDIMVPVPMEPLGSLPPAREETDVDVEAGAGVEHEARPGVVARVKRRLTGEAVEPR